VKLAARLRDVPGALERLLGTLRRRAVPIERLSVSHHATDGLEVVLVMGEAAITPERVVAELSHLRDVESVSPVDGALAGETRELALARLLEPNESWPPELHQLIGRARGGEVVELTGTPSEIDEALKLMKESGALSGVSRSGEVLPPGNTTLEP
jgi:acetolactate synthase small subunit